MMKIPVYVAEAIERLQRESFEQGWQAATAALIQAANSRPPAEPSTQSLPGVENFVNLLLAAGTNRERVKIALQARPGMRPGEIYGWLAQLGLKLKKESVLTAIKRMRGKDIEKFGEGYRLKERSA